MAGRLKKIPLGALALLALAGCTARSVEPAPELPRCELNAYAVCASGIENYFAAEAVRSCPGCAIEQLALDAPSSPP